MLGGIKTAAATGIEVPNRAEIYARISALPEGQLFRMEDIVAEDRHLAEDFTALRGHDYLHMADGWFVGVVETAHLRRLPRIEAMTASYEETRGCTLVETGDRVAWRLRLKQWEPILGLRFYSTGSDEYIAYTRHGTRMINAPDWLMQEDDTGRLLRAFHDTPAKEWDETLKRLRANARIPLEDVEKVVARCREIGALQEEEREHWEWLNCPQKIARLIETWLESRDNSKEAA